MHEVARRRGCAATNMGKAPRRMGIIVVGDWRVWSRDLAAEMISWVKVWIVSCMILGLEEGEQKVVIRLVRVGVWGSSMMGAGVAIFCSSFCMSK
jgi:hypothetical protein